MKVSGERRTNRDERVFEQLGVMHYQGRDYVQDKSPSILAVIGRWRCLRVNV
jgi:hypothetical protein